MTKGKFERAQQLVFMLANGVVLKDRKQVRGYAKLLAEEFGVDFDAIVASAA